MQIDVWSDVVCPWCYLGKRRLDAVLDALPWSDEVTVRWRAFQLDPTATTEPKDLAAAIDRKYGPGAFGAMSARLGALGADVGIDYRFDLAQRVTSVPAHMLAAWVEDEYGPEVADQLHDRLFRAYFTNGENIADPAGLARWAAEVGADADAASEAIAAGAGRERVAADLEAAADRQITGVPAFVIEDKHLIPGAQDQDTIRAILERVRTKLASD